MPEDIKPRFKLNRDTTIGVTVGFLVGIAENVVLTAQVLQANITILINTNTKSEQELV